MSAPPGWTPGIKDNRRQFSLLVAINLFVGAMIGLERTILPLIAQEEFGLASRTAILSFIVAFGLAKAIFNSIAGRSAERFGRRITLIAGWAVALPVPFLLMSATSWIWILVANLLLGMSQGLTWTATAVMKMDLAGPHQRGLAMGLNEASGYAALGVSALATSHLATIWGLRPEPFYLGVGYVSIGLLLSLLFVRETRTHARTESVDIEAAARNEPQSRMTDPVTASAAQAGFVTNLNDGMAWGLWPLLFASYGLSLDQSGFIAASYVGVWALAQLFAGALSDRWGRRGLITLGMFVQALGIFHTAISTQFDQFMVGAVVTGLGTAMVYPTLLAAVGDRARTARRAVALGIYRFWRDIGYAAGAVISGVLGDWLGIQRTMIAVALLTAASGWIVRIRMQPPARISASSSASPAA